MINSITKQVKILGNISEKGFITVVVIAAVETILLTALKQNYSIEINGEVSESTVKGTMKLQPS